MSFLGLCKMGGQFDCPVVVSLEATVVGYLGTAELGDCLGSLGNGVLGELFDLKKGNGMC